ncbi:hypothetical protein [Pseudoxanthomonas sp.]|uniref:hypothetical protein n=1 Tax=Pseudoxanthomonas sp. TaxID=1871049 RepID=UPI0026159EDE|nr:hypothetical protein [Pseudoxanthomonas sp.]WDS37104.1 MAG: hypothetical protein O8I58_04180 [Pseudoxanthomonas sp.]
MKTTLLRTAVAATLLTLAACQPGTGPVAQGLNEAQKGLEKASKEMDEASDEVAKARKELATENLKVGSDGNSKGLPKAEVTPSGELLIDGKPIAMTPAQKAAGLAYRTELQGVASDAIGIGMAGAKLGIDAAASAIKGLMSGQGGEAAGKQAEATAKEKIQPLVEQLCKRMPTLLKTQQAWAAAQPEFRPYATMDQSDVDDCSDKQDWNF